VRYQIENVSCWSQLLNLIDSMTADGHLVFGNIGPNPNPPANQKLTTIVNGCMQ